MTTMQEQGKAKLEEAERAQIRQRIRDFINWLDTTQKKKAEDVFIECAVRSFGDMPTFMAMMAIAKQRGYK